MDIKPIYIARWRQDEHLREFRLAADELGGLQTAATGDMQQLEEAVQKKAREYGWLLDGEALHFAAAERVDANNAGGASSIIPATHCIYLNFIFCPAADPKLRSKNLKERRPDWVELDRNRILAWVSGITLILVVFQFVLLIEQNAQFDDALRQFKTVVENYVWQVNTPGLWPNYLPDTKEFELVNYGQTPIGVTAVELITHSGRHSLLPNGPENLRPGGDKHIRALPSTFDGIDITDGVMIEIDYVYLGNRYRLLWAAEVVFARSGGAYIKPQGEPSIERLSAPSPTVTPTIQP